MKNEPIAQNFDDFSKICNRLRLIRSVFFGDDNYKFAEALGIHHSNASKLINGVSEPIFDLPAEQTMNKRLKEWAKAAGVNKKLSLHTARHTFATLLLTQGADIYTVSKLLGHSSVQTTQIYARIVDKKKEQAVDLLDNL